MISYPDPDDVLDALGDKVVEGVSTAVRRTRQELTDYRQFRPSWVAGHSERGLANWIHDRLWEHLRAALDDHPSITWLDGEPTRELVVGFNYRLRVKRHHRGDMVSTYPTQAALQFLDQQPALEGMELVHLIAGYRWSADEREIGPAVISLRDGADNVVWCVELPEAPSQPAVQPLPPAEGPDTPRIDVTTDDEDKDKGESE